MDMVEEMGWRIYRGEDWRYLEAGEGYLVC
jgi:hypothetical protein